MKYSILLLCSSIFSFASAQNSSIGIFQYNADIGNPKKAGSAVYNPADQSYNIKGGGYNIWFERDELHYLYNKIKGDFIVTANFEFVGKGTNAHRKIGWMVRGTAEDKSPHITATLHGDGLTVLQWRGEQGAAMRDPQDELFADTSWYNIIQIERSGKNITMRAAHTGEAFHTIGSHIMENLPDEVLAGLFVCSHDPEVIEEAKVWNVRIDKPVSDDFDPYKRDLSLRYQHEWIFTSLSHRSFKPSLVSPPDISTVVQPLYPILSSDFITAVQLTSPSSSFTPNPAPLPCLSAIFLLKSLI
jgi:hypothetical protein